MSILNLTGGFGLMGLIKGWTAEAARVDGRGTAPVMRSVEVPARRTRTAVPAPLREVERFEEDCERWDGLS